jgi:cell division protein FtsW (lipid II flippase)
MTNLIIQVSKYLIIILMALYTLHCFTVFHTKDEEEKHYMFLRQNMLMFFMHFVAFMVLYLQMEETTILLFYAAQVIYLAVVLFLFTHLYRRASRLLINNMCMLISIGFIMITRLSYDQSVKQFKIAVISSVVALLIPLLIRKLRFITKMYWAYTLLGIGMLALVAIAARTTYGAKLSFTVGGISIQPSEFVKIIFVFAIAGLLSHARDFRRIAIATALAGTHVLILVVSKDLGSALIFFITYLVMLFVSTRNPFYVLAGVLAGSVAAVGAYFMFNHVRVRVQAWQDPFGDYQGGGYQICQSLFAIAAGSWFGTGLCQGSPSAIPFVEQDFMFSAISEELGSIFGICLILVCMSCFIMFVNISMQLANRYYRLVAVGLGTTYAAQVFLTVGGGIKLIPSTGVTLPLVSYGGSSMLSTLIMFAIVQGLYMLQRDEEMKNEEKRLLREQQYYQAYPQRGYQQEGYYGGGYREEAYREDPYRPDDRR